MSRTERPAAPASPEQRPSSERRLTGIGIGPGVAIGPAFAVSEPAVAVPRSAIAEAAVEGELLRLEEAVHKSRRQLGKLRGRLAVLPEDTQAELAPLIDAYAQMLGASRLLRQTRARIAECRLNAEAAVHDEVESLAAGMLALPGEDPPGRQRRADEVREIGRRLLRNLGEQKFRSFGHLPQGAILIADTLRPSDAALIDPARIAGLAAEEGGADGHAAIMLRALGIPAVLGVHGLLMTAATGRMVVLDGGTGQVLVDPAVETLAGAKLAVAAQLRERQRLGRLRRLPAITTDHEIVELQANLELLAELPMIAQSGAAGIGLLRTEFLFANRPTLPDEAAQIEAYRTVIEAMDGERVTIRVLDWGGEKEIEALAGRGSASPEHNPALSLRGLRLLLREPALFETQLAAILRAAGDRPVRILLPMVTHLGELRAARAIYARVARRLRRRGEALPEKLPPLGIMIETPGAALAADSLALEADFFALGTNDLTMYTLAVDRSASDVAALYDPLHPAVLRLVQFATEAALRVRKPVSVCGEMAANPKLAPLLLGLGLRSFSMNASAVPRVKQAVRAVSAAECTRFARGVMQEGDPARIHALVAGFG